MSIFPVFMVVDSGHANRNKGGMVPVRVLAMVLVMEGAGTRRTEANDASQQMPAGIRLTRGSEEWVGGWREVEDAGTSASQRSLPYHASTTFDPRQAASVISEENQQTKAERSSARLIRDFSERLNKAEPAGTHRHKGQVVLASGIEIAKETLPQQKEPSGQHSTEARGTRDARSLACVYSTVTNKGWSVGVAAGTTTLPPAAAKGPKPIDDGLGTVRDAISAPATPRVRPAAPSSATRAPLERDPAPTPVIPMRADLMGKLSGRGIGAMSVRSGFLIPRPSLPRPHPQPFVMPRPGDALAAPCEVMEILVGVWRLPPWFIRSRSRALEAHSPERRSPRRRPSTTSPSKTSLSTAHPIHRHSCSATVRHYLSASLSLYGLPSVRPVLCTVPRP
ncbi:hypothetical protein G7Z17_g5875 [Cylindrodendrum hubeiense]|uniref:Uncharacterized protein n=1 Tax=Cylindrodendrum hubeiense TaxID=595255 RepID=A0A9P5LFR1_9HYPO|nr:hypothetical protein G7Z17_g5875 [Cylindrodendrum hubeiense]